MTLEDFKTPPASSIESTPAAVDSLETEVERLLEATGSQELYDRWWEKVADLPVSAQVEKLTELHTRRREALASAIPGNIEIHEALPDAFVEILRDRLKDAPELGRGHNGYVVAGTTNSRMAYKFLLRTPIGNQNSLVDEAAMQGEFYELLNKENPLVGVPALEYFSIDPRLSVIAMERIDGVSILDIIDGKASMPQHTDTEALFDALGVFLKFANDNRGYYHLDIRAGNIMLSNDQTAADTPKIYLIDFGMSKHRREVQSVKIIENGMFVTKVDKVSNYGSMRVVQDQLDNYLKRRKETI